MTAPRQVLPGSVTLSSRRCISGQFLLRPEPWLTSAVCYLLAVGSQRYGIRVLGVVFMSNHYHALLHDPLGRVPDFLEWFHPLVSKYVNHMRGRYGVVWDPNKKPSELRCETPQDALNKLVYALANPSAAGLVATADDWPGLITTPEQLVGGRPTVYYRPKEFFRPNGPLPDFAELTLHRIPGFEHLADDEYVAMVRERLTLDEADAAALRQEKGQSVAGRDHVLSVDWRDSPKADLPHHRISPRIAAKNPSIRVQAILRLKAFLKRYAEALACWRAGDRDVVFPSGTYALHFRHRARRRPPPNDVWRPLAEAA